MKTQPEKARKARLANCGAVVSVRGSVVDIRFDEQLPPIYSVLRAGTENQIVIEVLIVIVGIFLGLQVQSWNEERLDQKAGELYLAQIIEDLKYDLVVTEGILKVALPLKQSQLFRVEQLIKEYGNIDRLGRSRHPQV